MAIIIIKALLILIQIIDYAILIRCLLSWFPINRNNPVIAFIYTLTEPILSPIRNMISKSPLGSSALMIDFSPIFAFLLLSLISNLIRSFA